MLCSLGLTNLNVYRISPKIIGKDIVFLSWQSLYLPVFDANNLHRAEINENSGTNIILIAKDLKGLSSIFKNPVENHPDFDINTEKIMIINILENKSLNSNMFLNYIIYL